MTQLKNRYMHASPAKTRKSSHCDDGGTVCLFCGADETHDTIHSVSFTECDLNVKALATDLEDFDILGKLANGDLFAQDSVYHKEWMNK